jgi:hypothetical protein
VGEDGTPHEVLQVGGKRRLVVARLSDVRIVDAPADTPPKKVLQASDEDTEDEEKKDEWDGVSGGYLEQAGWNPIATARSLVGVCTGRCWRARRRR